MSAMSAEQQAVVILQQEMAQTQTHVAHSTHSYKDFKSAHDALNFAAQHALAEKEQKIPESEDRLRGLIFCQQFDLLDSKEIKPDLFKGRAQRLSILSLQLRGALMVTCDCSFLLW